MTNHWIDIKNSDCILIMGSNAAENHPISFKYVTEAQQNGAKLISVDPRFTRTSARADMYAPMRSGTDIAILGGMIKYIIDNRLYFQEYVANYTTPRLSSAGPLNSRTVCLPDTIPRPRVTTRANGPLKWTPTAFPKWIAR